MLTYITPPLLTRCSHQPLLALFPQSHPGTFRVLLLRKRGSVVSAAAMRTFGTKFAGGLEHRAAVHAVLRMLRYLHAAGWDN